MDKLFQLHAGSPPTPHGWMIQSDSLNDALDQVDQARRFARDQPGYDPNERYLVVLPDLQESNADLSDILRRYSDFLARIIFVLPPAARDHLETWRRSCPVLCLATEETEELQRYGALSLNSAAIQRLSELAIRTRLDLARGKPVVLRGVLSAPDRDFLGRIIRPTDFVVFSEATPKPVPFLMLSASAPGHLRLQLERERVQIQQGIGTPFLSFAARTLSELEGQLRQWRPRILHFAGHGDRARLWFTGTGDLAQPETGERVAAAITTALGPDSPLELIVLNACESEAFVDSLTPLCCGLVVMSRPVSDAAAIAFAGAFYAHMRRNGVFKALEEAQKAMVAVDPSASDILRWHEGKAGACRRTSAAEVGEPVLRGGVKRSEKPKSTVTVWFGTERKLRNPNDLSRGFSDVQGDVLHTGRVEVRIQQGKYGAIDVGVFTGERVSMIPSSLRLLSLSDWHAGIRGGLKKWNEDQKTDPALLVFVHGFNVGFENAARRAAQIHHDLNFPGITSFYSWASNNRFADYFDDEDRVLRAVPHLQVFIEGLLEITEAKRFHLLAHSMGNRPLLRVLHSISDRVQKRTNKRFGQIFLCAPDMEANDFRRLATVLPKVSERATLYISRKDRALQLSSLIHQDNRAGLYPEVTVIDGIDTIATEAVSAQALGINHGFYADNDVLLSDFGRLLADNSPPQRRQRLNPVAGPNGRTYFQFNA